MKTSILLYVVGGLLLALLAATTQAWVTKQRLQTSEATVAAREAEVAAVTQARDVANGETKICKDQLDAQSAAIVDLQKKGTTAAEQDATTARKALARPLPTVAGAGPVVLNGWVATLREGAE